MVTITLTLEDAEILYYEMLRPDVPESSRAGIAFAKIAEQLYLPLHEERRWANQKEPCDGTGMAHGPHGGCPGYSRDRT